MSLGRFNGPAIVVAVVAVLAVTFGHLLGPFDFLTFLHAGKQVLEGRSPYPGVDSPVFRSGHGFVYPLFVAWMFAPLALVPRIPAEVIYGVGSVAAIVVSSRMLGRRDFSAAALVLVCSTTIIGLQMGTVNAFLLLGLAASWHWRASRPVLSGLLLGVTAAAKLFLLPVLAWPLLMRRWSTTTAAAGTVAALILAGGLFGTVTPIRYFHLLSQLQANEQVSSWSLSSLFQSVGLPRTAASVAAVAVVAACLVVLWRRRRLLRDGQVLGAMVVGSLLMSPIVWSSYLLLLAVPLLLVDRHDRLLAVAAAASWLVVTPDAASGLRVGVGAVLALAVAYLAARGHLGGVARTLRDQPRYLGSLIGAGAVAGVAILVLPGPVRSPLPALAAMALVGLRCVRRERSGPGPLAPPGTVAADAY
ncbi:MAG TPA: glycosyltransferase family 87 protein [Acidimicrobiales bacterium]|nr:glycosyltransferase family 87 protein [Acidimicrobiales bacterium]